MKYFDWNKEKNILSLKVRGISFEMAKEVIESGDILDIVDNPNQKKYPGQKMYIIRISEYVCAVPFVEDEEKIFLKTIFPSRKLNRLYLK